MSSCDVAFMFATARERSIGIGVGRVVFLEALNVAAPVGSALEALAPEAV